jgi:hypothetical protein
MARRHFWTTPASGRYGAGRAANVRRGWLVIEWATQRTIPPYAVYPTLRAALEEAEIRAQMDAADPHPY